MAIADFNGDGAEELIAATLDGGVTLQLIGWGSSGTVSDSCGSSRVFPSTPTRSEAVISALTLP